MKRNETVFFSLNVVTDKNGKTHLVDEDANRCTSQVSGKRKSLNFTRCTRDATKEVSRRFDTVERVCDHHFSEIVSMGKDATNAYAVDFTFVGKLNGVVKTLAGMVEINQGRGIYGALEALHEIEGSSWIHVVSMRSVRNVEREKMRQAYWLAAFEYPDYHSLFMLYLDCERDSLQQAMVDVEGNTAMNSQAPPMQTINSESLAGFTQIVLLSTAEAVKLRDRENLERYLSDPESYGLGLVSRNSGDLAIEVARNGHLRSVGGGFGRWLVGIAKEEVRTRNKGQPRRGRAEANLRQVLLVSAFALVALWDLLQTDPDNSPVVMTGTAGVKASILIDAARLLGNQQEASLYSRRLIHVIGYLEEHVVKGVDVLLRRKVARDLVNELSASLRREGVE